MAVAILAAQKGGQQGRGVKGFAWAHCSATLKKTSHAPSFLLLDAVEEARLIGMGRFFPAALGFGWGVEQEPIFSASSCEVGKACGRRCSDLARTSMVPLPMSSLDNQTSVPGGTCSGHGLNSSANVRLPTPKNNDESVFGEDIIVGEVFWLSNWLSNRQR